MPVHIDPPITVSSVPERTFDVWFYTDFQVTDITPTGGRLSFSKVPMNSVTGDTLPEQAVGVACDNVWAVAQAVPSAATAMAAVVASLPDIEAWKNL